MEKLYDCPATALSYGKGDCGVVDNLNDELTHLRANMGQLQLGYEELKAENEKLRGILKVYKKYIKDNSLLPLLTELCLNIDAKIALGRYTTTYGEAIKNEAKVALEYIMFKAEHTLKGGE